MGASHATLAGPLPHPHSAEILRYGDRYIQARAIECPIERATTYYIDQSASGSHTGGGGLGSLASPYLCVDNEDVRLLCESLAAPGVAFLFNRGSVFRGQTNLADFEDIDDITVAAYGTGADPEFRHTTLLTAGWTLDSGTTYTRSQSGVAWVLIPGDDLYLTAPLCRVAAAGEVPTTITGTGGTWNETTSTLKVDAGVDLNATSSEIILDNNDNGFLFAGDGCRVDGLLLVGFGAHTASPHNQIYPVKFTGGGTNAILVTNCQAYYTSTHGMSMNTPAGGGGFMALANCRQAWSQPYAAGSVTFYNGFSWDGGHEFVIVDCWAGGGELPNTTSPAPSGTICFGHTDSNTAALYMAVRCTTQPYTENPYTSNWGPWGDAPDPSYDLSDYRAFFIGCEAYDRTLIAQNDPTNCYINCEASVAWPAPGGALASLTSNLDWRGYYINCVWHLDITAANSTNVALLNDTSTPVHDAHLDHCEYRIVGTKSGLTPIHRINTRSSNDEVITGVLRNCNIINTTALTRVRVGLGNTSDILKGTGIYGIESSTAADAHEGYSNDAKLLIYSQVPPLGGPVTGTPSVLADDIGLEYDFLGKTRLAANVTRGPFAAPQSTTQPTVRPTIRRTVRSPLELY